MSGILQGFIGGVGQVGMQRRQERLQEEEKELARRIDYLQWRAAQPTTSQDDARAMMAELDQLIGGGGKGKGKQGKGGISGFFEKILTGLGGGAPTERPTPWTSGRTPPLLPSGQAPGAQAGPAGQAPAPGQVQGKYGPYTPDQYERAGIGEAMDYRPGRDFDPNRRPSLNQFPSPGQTLVPAPAAEAPTGSSIPQMEDFYREDFFPQSTAPASPQQPQQPSLVSPAPGWRERLAEIRRQRFPNAGTGKETNAEIKARQEFDERVGLAEAEHILGEPQREEARKLQREQMELAGWVKSPQIIRTKEGGLAEVYTNPRMPSGQDTRIMPLPAGAALEAKPKFSDIDEIARGAYENALRIGQSEAGARVKAYEAVDAYLKGVVALPAATAESKKAYAAYTRERPRTPAGQPTAALTYKMTVEEAEAGSKIAGLYQDLAKAKTNAADPALTDASRKLAQSTAQALPGKIKDAIRKYVQIYGPQFLEKLRQAGIEVPAGFDAGTQIPVQVAPPPRTAPPQSRKGGPTKVLIGKIHIDAQTGKRYRITGFDAEGKAELEEIK